jgi:hypothetical protein
MTWLWRKDSNLRMAALTVRCLTNLATPQEMVAGAGVNKISYCQLPIADLGRLFVVNSSCLRNQLEVGNRKSAMSWLRRRDLNSYTRVYKTSAQKPIELRRNFWWTGRDSNPHKKFAGLLCSRLHHQPKISFEFRVETSFINLGIELLNSELETDPWWLWVESNHQPRAYETLALPLELHSR